ncbi:hypothetical protein NQ317_000061 [Molorchus minor]|uniref:Peptidase aspartic putative domain-containing protein n=1 Tax=Molorchus minor TaxID=1323400 RepID=A0ABQ9JIR7_9CUCU|nr:hypothetical protein NQ317_000061 [Molorchus minor]
MLIGADILFDLISPGIIRLGPNLPTLQNTHLGWVIAGPVYNENSCSHISIALFSQEQPLEKLIPKFWQIEEIETKRFLSPEDKLCEQKFLDSVKRLENGAFQVDLPLINPDQPLKCIQLETVTYGTNCAPYLATRCLVKLAQEASLTYPLASNAVLNQCYVDDILAGTNEIQDCAQLVRELNEMLNSAQFHLHKWCSNDSSILSSISSYSASNKADNEVIINSETPVNKVLGISWNPQSDVFKISVPKLDNIVLWTDSQIVLNWLNSSPSRWTTFVANRVSEIQELTINAIWTHIKSAENPSDFLSRVYDLLQTRNRDVPTIQVPYQLKSYIIH